MIEIEDAQELRKFAGSLFARNKYKSALLIYRSLYDANRQADDLLNAGVAGRLAGFNQLSNVLFKQLTSNFEVSSSVFMEAGLSALSVNDYDGALGFFSRAHTATRSAETAIWCAVSRKRKNEMASAITWLETAIEIDSNNKTALIELAQCEESLGNYGQAIECYKKAKVLSTGKDFAFVADRLGLIFKKLGDTGQLRELVRSPQYFNCIETDYSFRNSILWSLFVGVPVPITQIKRYLESIHQGTDDRDLLDHLSLFIAKSFIDNIETEDAFSILQRSNYGASVNQAYKIFTENYYASIGSQVFQDTKISVGQLCSAINARQPYSLIRLGDGEGNFLGPLYQPGNALLQRQSDKILKNWFGEDLENLDFSPVAEQLQLAIAGADLLGVPNAARIQYELTNDPRGFWGVLLAALYVHQNAALRVLTTPNLHLELFTNPLFIDAVKDCTALNTISCHASFGNTIRSKLDLNSGLDVVVPGEKGISALPSVAKAGSHYPDRYRQVLTEIRKFVPGSVTFVAAGVLGKIYANHAKQNGCIAIDIGAMADQIMGFSTRQIFDVESFRSKIII